MELTNKLEKLNTYPFHMPGHKRQSGLGIYGEGIDITEIDGFDNLHNPKDIIANLQDKISRLFGYHNSIISVNGSTCGILAAISSVAELGDTIIIARNCHKSVYNACFINKLRIKYIEPEWNSEFGCFGKITQESVNTAINEVEKPCAVVITSPTYEGIVSEIECDVPLIIDAAHGAAFSFADWMPNKANGDIVIQSIHKTLPALTQTAVVHINKDELFQGVKKYMDIYESSSPSYVLMSSIDKCASFLENCEESFNSFKNRLDSFYNAIKSLDNVSILANDDISRIILSIDGYSGDEIAQRLREKYAIEVEGATLQYVILISTVCDSDEGFERLINAINSFKKRDKITQGYKKPSIPNKACEIFEVKDCKETIFKNSAGMISGEYIYAYPPGCPILAPGEEISKEIIDYISALIDANVNILSDSNLLPLKILTKI